FVHEEGAFRLRAVCAETPTLTQQIRSRERDEGVRSAIEIANRAVSAGELITVTINGFSHLGEKAIAGVLIASPFRSSRSYGVILVYPRESSAFSSEEKTLVSTLAGFGAVAIANAELYGMARAQAQELHQMLEISIELGSAGKLDQFMQTFVARASTFLGFRRCFVGLL